MKKDMLRIGAFILFAMLAFRGFSFAAEKQLTNIKFAQMLVQKLNIKLPPGIEQLSLSEYYKALSKALEEKGVTNFANTGSNDLVTCARLAEVLYTVVKGGEQLDTKGKIQNLVCRGCFLSCTSPKDNVAACANKVICTNTEKDKNLVMCVNPNAIATVAALEQDLNTPCAMGAIAEAYRPPEPPRVIPPPPERHREDPTSQN